MEVGRSSLCRSAPPAFSSRPTRAHALRVPSTDRPAASPAAAVTTLAALAGSPGETDAEAAPPLFPAEVMARITLSLRGRDLVNASLADVSMYEMLRPALLSQRIEAQACAVFRLGELRALIALLHDMPARLCARPLTALARRIRALQGPDTTQGFHAILAALPGVRVAHRAEPLLQLLSQLPQLSSEDRGTAMLALLEQIRYLAVPARTALLARVPSYFQHFHEADSAQIFDALAAACEQIHPGAQRAVVLVQMAARLYDSPTRDWHPALTRLLAMTGALAPPERACILAHAGGHLYAFSRDDEHVVAFDEVMSAMTKDGDPVFFETVLAISDAVPWLPADVRADRFHRTLSLATRLAPAGRAAVLKHLAQVFEFLADAEERKRAFYGVLTTTRELPSPHQTEPLEKLALQIACLAPRDRMAAHATLRATHPGT